MKAKNGVYVLITIICLFFMCAALNGDITKYMKKTQGNTVSPGPAIYSKSAWSAYSGNTYYMPDENGSIRKYSGDGIYSRGYTKMSVPKDHFTRAIMIGDQLLVVIDNGDSNMTWKRWQTKTEELIGEGELPHKKLDAVGYVDGKIYIFHNKDDYAVYKGFWMESPIYEGELFRVNQNKGNVEACCAVSTVYTGIAIVGKRSGEKGILAMASVEENGELKDTGYHLIDYGECDEWTVGFQYLAGGENRYKVYVTGLDTGDDAFYTWSYNLDGLLPKYVDRTKLRDGGFMVHYSGLCSIVTSENTVKNKDTSDEHISEIKTTYRVLSSYHDLFESLVIYVSYMMSFPGTTWKDCGHNNSDFSWNEEKNYNPKYLANPLGVILGVIPNDQAQAALDKDMNVFYNHVGFGLIDKESCTASTKSGVTGSVKTPFLKGGGSYSATFYSESSTTITKDLWFYDTKGNEKNNYGVNAGAWIFETPGRVSVCKLNAYDHDNKLIPDVNKMEMVVPLGSDIHLARFNITEPSEAQYGYGETFKTMPKMPSVNDPEAWTRDPLKTLAGKSVTVSNDNYDTVTIDANVAATLQIKRSKVYSKGVDFSISLIPGFFGKISAGTSWESSRISSITSEDIIGWSYRPGQDGLPVPSDNMKGYYIRPSVSEYKAGLNWWIPETYKKAGARPFVITYKWISKCAR